MPLSAIFQLYMNTRVKNGVIFQSEGEMSLNYCDFSDQNSQLSK